MIYALCVSFLLCDHTCFLWDIPYSQYYWCVLGVLPVAVAEFWASSDSICVVAVSSPWLGLWLVGELAELDGSYWVWREIQWTCPNTPAPTGIHPVELAAVTV